MESSKRRISCTFYPTPALLPSFFMFFSLPLPFLPQLPHLASCSSSFLYLFPFLCKHSFVYCFISMFFYVLCALDSFPCVLVLVLFVLLAFLSVVVAVGAFCSFCCCCCRFLFFS
ncbi:MAG: hypothetical protein JOS17DRAFT_125648 [Linnemannia elongata]|nr:MAG: hypothetical protein JOS17DRAFT_125648 [Linnemannia elongata]